MIRKHMISFFYEFNIYFDTLLDRNFINNFLNCLAWYSIIIFTMNY